MSQNASRTDSNGRNKETICAVVALVLAAVLPSACISERDDQHEQAQHEVASAETGQISGLSYLTHTEAVIAAARRSDPELTNPVVTNAVVIFSDETSIDLRAQIQADSGYCQWFGVQGEVVDAALRWRAAQTDTCDE